MQALLYCGLGLAGLGAAMAVCTIFWDDGPTFTLKWPRTFVLGVILILSSML